jgi:hypothetical protein
MRAHTISAFLTYILLIVSALSSGGSAAGPRRLVPHASRQQSESSRGQRSGNVPEGRKNDNALDLVSFRRSLRTEASSTLNNQVETVSSTAKSPDAWGTEESEGDGGFRDDVLSFVVPKASSSKDESSTEETSASSDDESSARRLVELVNNEVSKPPEVIVDAWNSEESEEEGVRDGAVVTVLTPPRTAPPKDAAISFDQIPTEDSSSEDTSEESASSSSESSASEASSAESSASETSSAESSSDESVRYPARRLRGVALL